MWCIPKVDADFVAAMEAVLECYQQAYNPKEPVVCFDETSKQLIAETRIPLPMKVGQAMRYDYEYERRGTRNLPYHKTATKCGTYCTQFVPSLIKCLGFI